MNESEPYKQYLNLFIDYKNGNSSPMRKNNKRSFFLEKKKRKDVYFTI